MKQKRTRNEYRYTDELEQFTLHLDEEIGETRITTKKRNTKKESEELWYYIGFAGDFGFSVAIPIVGGAFAGYYLDKRWSTYPRATLILLLFGVILSVLGLIKTIKGLMQKKK